MEKTHKPRKGRKNQKRYVYPNALEDLREDRGFTAAHVAAKIGVDYTFYKKVEAGESFPNVYLALMLANILEAPLNEIFPSFSEWKQDLISQKEMLLCSQGMKGNQ